MSLKIVYGAPCSGKSTFVRKSIGANDIVYDYDEITRALTYGKEHLSKREISHKYVLDIRFTLLRRYKLGTDVETFWLISTFLTDGFKDFLDDFDVEYIKMETDQEECLKRLENDDMRPDKDLWRLKIEEWFDKYGDKEEITKKNKPNNAKTIYNKERKQQLTNKTSKIITEKRLINPYIEVK